MGAASDLHRAFGHGFRHGVRFRPVTLLAGAAIDGDGFLDQAQAGRKASASAFCAGVSDLHEAGEGACAVRRLKWIFRKEEWLGDGRPAIAIQLICAPIELMQAVESGGRAHTQGDRVKAIHNGTSRNRRPGPG